MESRKQYLFLMIAHLMGKQLAKLLKQLMNDYTEYTMNDYTERSSSVLLYNARI